MGDKRKFNASASTARPTLREAHARMIKWRQTMDLVTTIARNRYVACGGCDIATQSRQTRFARRREYRAGPSGRRAPRERLKAVRPAHSARGASTSKAEVPQQARAFTNHEDERNCTDQTPSDTDAKKKAVCVQEKNLFEVEIVLTAGVLLTQLSKPPECRFAYAMLS